MKLCLHKGLAWCTVHRAFHLERHIDVTTVGSPTREFVCVTCGGYRLEPREESCRYA